MPVTDRLKLLRGDIVTMEVDAIVNAANRSLLGGGGVDGAIHDAAGPELVQECRGLGGCETGQAKATFGYRLPAKHVIHTVGPIYSGREEDARLLASCYRESLRLADSMGLKSLAFPSISTGVYGYPIKLACPIALRTVIEELASLSDIREVRFVLFSEGDLLVYRETLNDLMQSQGVT